MHVAHGCARAARCPVQDLTGTAEGPSRPAKGARPIAKSCHDGTNSKAVRVGKSCESKRREEHRPEQASYRNRIVSTGACGLSRRGPGRAAARFPNRSTYCTRDFSEVQAYAEKKLLKQDFLTRYTTVMRAKAAVPPALEVRRQRGRHGHIQACEPSSSSPWWGALSPEGSQYQVQNIGGGLVAPQLYSQILRVRQLRRSSGCAQASVVPSKGMAGSTTAGWALNLPDAPLLDTSAHALGNGGPQVHRQQKPREAVCRLTDLCGFAIGTV